MLGNWLGLVGALSITAAMPLGGEAMPSPFFVNLDLVEQPRRGDDYYAVGFALGRSFVIQRYVGEGGRKGQLAKFRGQGFQGMSGGPVVDRDGRQVAVLTAILRDGLPVMFARPLADTWLCKGNQG